MGVDAIADEDWWMLEVDMDQLRDTLLLEQQYWIHAVEAAQQAGTCALELTEGTTCSWADILKTGKFKNLPTTTPILSKDIDHPAKPANLTTPTLTRTPKSGNYKVSIDKMSKKNSRKRKPSAEINKDNKLHGSLQSYRERRDQVNRICQEALDANNSSLRLFSQRNSLSRREKSNITTALKEAPKYKREQTVDGEWVLNKVAAYNRGQCNVYQSDFSRLDGDEWLDDAIIDMFLRATVQNTVPRVHCYTSHFFNILDEGEYVGFGPRGTSPDPPNTPREDLQVSSFRGVNNWRKTTWMAVLTMWIISSSQLTLEIFTGCSFM